MSNECFSSVALQSLRVRKSVLKSLLLRLEVNSEIFFISVARTSSCSRFGTCTRNRSLTFDGHVVCTLLMFASRYLVSFLSVSKTNTT